jgi:hypothetical protein
VQAGISAKSRRVCLTDPILGPWVEGEAARRAQWPLAPEHADRVVDRVSGRKRRSRPSYGRESPRTTGDFQRWPCSSDQAFMVSGTLFVQKGSDIGVSGWDSTRSREGTAAGTGSSTPGQTQRSSSSSTTIFRGPTRFTNSGTIGWPDSSSKKAGSSGSVPAMTSPADQVPGADRSGSAVDLADLRYRGTDDLPSLLPRELSPQWTSYPVTQLNRSQR